MSLLDDDILEQVDDKILTVENAVDHFCKNKWPEKAIYFSDLSSNPSDLENDYVILYNTYYGSQAVFVKIGKPTVETYDFNKSSWDFNSFSWKPVYINMGEGIHKRLTLGFLKEMYGLT
jgi:hypothetical protein